MKGVLTTTNNKHGEEVYWHYHAIGVGTIFHYHLKAMQVSMTCEHTGQMISTQDFYQHGGITKEEFKELCATMYKDAVDEGKTINLDYMENPEIVGCIGVDFNLLKN